MKKLKLLRIFVVLAWSNVLLSAFLSLSCVAQNSVPSTPASRASRTELALQERIDISIKAKLQELRVPGYALAIIRDGRLIFRRGYGTTDLDNGVPVTSRTVFGLASITKTFTALTLLTLVDQGRINLDDRLDKYLEGLTPAWRPLTIRQLASMSAGILKAMPNEKPWPEQFKLVQQQPLVSEPGSDFLYSNFSYRTLGSVIERVTGQPYETVVRELILTPLGMPATGTQLGVQNELLAQPYALRPDGALHRLPPYRNPAIPFAAGELFSNIDDMLTYSQALLDGKILSPAGYKTLWVDRPPLSGGKPDPWAFGWSSSRPQAFGNRLVVSMNGGVPGVASTIFIVPDEKVAIVSLANLRDKSVHDIARQVALLYFGGAGGADDIMPESGQ